MVRPLLTVGISVFNAARMLDDSLRSVFSQTFTDWELVIVDDGSTDTSPQILRRIRDPRVRVVCDTQNRGYMVRVNQLTDLARGKYIGRMDADDMCHPERFERQVAFLEEHCDTDLVSCGYLALDANDRIIGQRDCPMTHEEICRTAHKSISLVHAGVVGHGDWFRRNRYPEEFRAVEDQALWMSCHRTSKFAGLDEPLYFYRVVGTHTLRKHLHAEYMVARLIWRYSRHDYPFLLVASAIAGRFLRMGAYVFAGMVGLRRQLLAKRFGKTDQATEKWFEEAIRRIRQTEIPGLSDALERGSA